MFQKRRIHPRVVQALQATGLPYEFQDGGRHIKIRLAGYFVGILPKGGNSDSFGVTRAVNNSVTQIRRKARQLSEEQAA
jgi:hypothetical protein